MSDNTTETPAVVPGLNVAAPAADTGLKSDYYFFKSTPKDQLESYMPKPLAAPAESTAVPKGSSTWNSAGTWEESDATAWALDRLREIFIGVAPTNGVDVKVTEAVSATGEACRIMSRGKRRANFEVSVKLTWEGTDASGAAATGSVEFNEVDSASADDFSVKVTADADDAAHTALRAAMRTCEKEFRRRMVQFSKELLE